MTNSSFLLKITPFTTESADEVLNHSSCVSSHGINYKKCLLKVCMVAVSYRSEKKWVACNSNFLKYVKRFPRYPLATSLAQIGCEEIESKTLS